MRGTHFRAEAPGCGVTSSESQTWLSKAKRYWQKDNDADGQPDSKRRKLRRVAACDHLVAVDTALRLLTDKDLGGFAFAEGDDIRDIMELPLHIPVEDRVVEVVGLGVCLISPNIPMSPSFHTSDVHPQLV